ncbi:SpoIIE family protein phosphatase [Staphylococcus aureus]|uniref:SpoIIE family protein phosphatase n=1 Tax=Staphylococcus aureus TaxID=1280 RepID=UPI0039B792E0
MFVTMFYGLYEEMNHLLYCSSAGHEPGYIYRAEKEEFEEISVRGRVLGISSQTRYQQHDLNVLSHHSVIVSVHKNPCQTLSYSLLKQLVYLSQ